MQIRQKATYGDCRIRALADELHRSRATFYLAIQLAEAYPGDAIKQLEGLPFSAIKVLLAVKDAQLRRDLLKDAKKHHWSYRRLQQEVDRRRGKQLARGGRRRMPENQPDDLRELVRLSERVQRFIKDVWPSSRLDALPTQGQELTACVRKAEEALGRLIRSTEKLLAREGVEGSGSPPWPSHALQEVRLVASVMARGEVVP